MIWVFLKACNYFMQIWWSLTMDDHKQLDINYDKFLNNSEAKLSLI